MPLERDSRLGKYIIRQRIGAGGMGVVYRARDEVLGRQVAIKTILADKATDREFLSRFRREAFAISRIEHPHIVKLLDFVEANPKKDEPSFMVMEFLPGQDLERFIKSGPLGINRAVDRMLEVCAAVGECHRLGYVHRDLKPTNIFLAEYNQIETAKVLDFGAAKLEDRHEGESEDLAELTKKGTFLGTPFYTPPELIAGQSATAKADQYSLAVVLYTALAGVKPFELDKKTKFPNVELLHAIIKGDHVDLRTHRSEVPQGLAAVIEKAMHVDPSKRFVDLHTFGAELRLWASPQIRTMWEARFTSSPPVKRSLKVSIAIMPTAEGSAANASESMASPADGPTSRDATVPPSGPHRMTSPTVASGRKPQPKEALIGPNALGIASGEISHATTAVQQPRELESSSISIDFHDPAQPPSESVSSEAPPKTVSPMHRFRTALSSLVRRPAAVIAVAALALASVLVSSLLLNRARPTAAETHTPPPDLFVRPSAAPALPPAATVAPRPVPQAEPVPPAPSSKSSTIPDTSPPPPETRRPANRHHRQILDPHGIPIPSD